MQSPNGAMFLSAQMETLSNANMIWDVWFWFIGSYLDPSYTTYPNSNAWYYFLGRYAWQAPGSYVWPVMSSLERVQARLCERFVIDNGDPYWFIEVLNDGAAWYPNAPWNICHITSNGAKFLKFLYLQP